MIKIAQPEQCCGCTACASICPKEAISMKPDKLGFLYPVVDTGKCTNCGLCEKVCTFNENYERNTYSTEIYAARNKDIQEIEKSRSGAIFAVLTDIILKNGGTVYGAGYDKHFYVKHKRATTTKERDEFRGSKYVQSDVCNTFLRIAQDLKNGLCTCFSGTPCQTAGLKSFLNTKKINTEKLLLIDIVCHGTPAPYVWNDYLSYMEKKHKGTATAVSFRDKTELGWAAHKESFVINGKKIVADTYTDLFYQHIMFRHSCGVCHFTNFQRASDITLADFWGWEKVDENFNIDDKGVSMVLINSEKGRCFFEKISPLINIKKTELKFGLQPNLQHPSIISPNRNIFEEEYHKHGFLYVAKKYGNIGRTYRVKNQLSSLITKIKWNITNRIIKKLQKEKR